MKNKRRLSLILIFVLIATVFTAAFAMSSFAVSQEEYDAAQQAAKEAKEATEAKRKEAKAAAKKAAQAVANFEEAEKELENITKPYFEDGLRKGIEQGIAQGVAQGVAQSKAEIAKTMLAKGYDPATVQELTGLTVEEIAALEV